MTQHRFSHDNRYCLFFVQNTDTFLFVGVIVNNEDMSAIKSMITNTVYTVDDFVTYVNESIGGNVF